MPWSATAYVTVGRAERLEVHGGHGEFRIGRVSGDADITVKSGSARITHVDGSLRLKGRMVRSSALSSLDPSTR